MILSNFEAAVSRVGSIGAGFFYPLCSDMRTMPGLSKRPGVREGGEIVLNSKESLETNLQALLD
jgi:formyltetrahydrofolate synthetase